MNIPVGRPNPNQGPKAQGLGLSPEKVFQLLSIVTVDGQPIVSPEAQGNFKETARQITEYFSKNHGISVKELPLLAREIMKDVSSGNINWRG